MINPNNQDQKNWKKSTITRTIGMVVTLITGGLIQGLEDNIITAIIKILGMLIGFYLIFHATDDIIYGKRLVKKRLKE